MDFSSTGKRALVTGSTAGIGYAIAAALAREGAEVVINGRTEEGVAKAVQTLKAETGGDVVGFAGDLGGAPAAEALFPVRAHRESTSSSTTSASSNRSPSKRSRIPTGAGCSRSM